MPALLVNILLEKGDIMHCLEKLNLDQLNIGAYAGNQWEAAPTASKLVSYNPATGEEIAAIYPCSAESMAKILDYAQEAAHIWRQYPAPKRGEIVRQIGQLLREKKDALGSLVALEMGKSKVEGDGEVQEMIDIADFALGQSRMLYGKTMHSERPNHRMYEQWHPYGIVGVISAFNFPVAVWAWNAFIAAICGNVTVWKPSTKTPLCAVAVQLICNEVLAKNNLPAIFNLVIPTEHDVAHQLVMDKRVPLLSFTGSTAVGKKIAQQVAARLGQTILELGGNNAIILDKSADLALAIPAIVFGAVGTAGQRCTSTRRLLIHESLFDEVLDKLKKAYQQVTIGNPLDTQNLMGPLIDQQAVNQFKQTIHSIKVAGGHIIFGGEVIEQAGYFVQPTIVSQLKPTDAIVQSETFAPILYVMSFQSMDQALQVHNNVPQGLSSAIFTNELKHAEYFLSALGSDCGIANVNIGTSGAEIGGAFGGEKETGGGREAGSDAWKAYMRRQTTTINWGDIVPLAQGIEFNLK